MPPDPRTCRVLRMLCTSSSRPSPSQRSSRVPEMSQHEDSTLRYGEGTERLSQLSDIVSLSQDLDFSIKDTQRALASPSARESILDFAEDLPSQAVLSTPELPFASQGKDITGARVVTEPAQSHDISAAPEMPVTDDEQAYVPERSRNSRRATRRG